MVVTISLGRFVADQMWSQISIHAIKYIYIYIYMRESEYLNLKIFMDLIS